MLPDNISQYLAKRGLNYGHSLDLNSSFSLKGAIIIPVLAEFTTIHHLIDSLIADQTLKDSGYGVIFVVNNRIDATPDVKSDNLQTIELLSGLRNKLSFPLGFIDAASPGLELPAKGGGVGLARKIGHDLILPHLDYNCLDPVLVSLDADTTVHPGYAEAIAAHFRTAATGGAVIPFEHRQGEGELENRAIERYELFLRYYVAALRHAGSPYAFHTVGSAMACRASAYVSCGGMNTKMAGEDFYFLQALAKSAGVSQVNGTKVYPSPRRSWRVPFGTGRAVSALLDSDPDSVLFYHPIVFEILGSWLYLAKQCCLEQDEDLPVKCGEISVELLAYLDQQGFADVWKRFFKQHKSPTALKAAFDGWFDAFRTMKLLHHLSDRVHPRGEPEEMLANYPESWVGARTSITEMLAYLRKVQC